MDQDTAQKLVQKKVQLEQKLKGTTDPIAKVVISQQISSLEKAITTPKPLNEEAVVEEEDLLEARDSVGTRLKQGDTIQAKINSNWSAPEHITHISKNNRLVFTHKGSIYAGRDVKKLRANRLFSEEVEKVAAAVMCKVLAKRKGK